MQENNKSISSAGFVARIKVWQWLVVSLLLVIGVALVLFFRWNGIPLQSLQADEEIIAHFHEHRADIEALVKSYREFRPTPQKNNWGELPEVRELMHKAAVERVTGELPTWFPNPYSMEAAKQFHQFIMDDKGKSGMHIFHSYETIAVSETGFGAPRIVILSSGNKLVFKNLIYTPEVPHIENGILLPPASITSMSPQPWPVPARVFASLDRLPPDWGKRGECVYRQLEPQWFIRMCISL